MHIKEDLVYDKHEGCLSVTVRQHLEALYCQDTESEEGLRLVPKLKYEHTYLSSFSKMRVDLAAQVSNLPFASPPRTIYLVVIIKLLCAH